MGRGGSCKICVATKSTPAVSRFEIIQALRLSEIHSKGIPCSLRGSAGKDTEIGEVLVGASDTMVLLPI